MMPCEPEYFSILVILLIIILITVAETSLLLGAW